MPGGFFPASNLVRKAPASLVMRCGACGLYKTCKSPKMPTSGEGRRRVLIVGEAPGKDEDKEGVQFVGETGQKLERTLAKIGVDIRTDCWLENTLICRPPDNATPTADQIDYCRPHLVKAIEELQPEVIIPLGTPAVQSLIGHVWKEDVGGIMKWAGWRIPSQKPNAWICPTFHPSFVCRSEKNAAVEVLWKRHLEAAFSLSGRPWQELPDYSSKVRRILDPDEARAAVLGFIERGRPTGFDYETNTLKPETPGAMIVSASLADEDHAIAFPWIGERLKVAVGKFLRSDVPKVASNLKFEDRWTRFEFGHGVNAWKWDTMIAAHWQDCRQGVTSIKFQSFVTLGAPAYDEDISPFLKSAKGTKLNQILKEIDLDKLLLYNGLDSLLEVLTAKKQAEVGNVEW